MAVINKTTGHIDLIIHVHRQGALMCINVQELVSMIKLWPGGHR